MQVRTLCILRECDAEMARTMTLSCTTHDVVIVGSSHVASDIRTLIKSTRPDLVFYDPLLDQGELLIKWQAEIGLMPVLVCWTSEPAYAVMAFEAGAAHYLMDRCAHTDLTLALDRCARRIARRSQHLHLSERAPEPSYHANVVALPVTSGIEVRKCDKIVHVHGEGNYTKVIFDHEPAILLSRTIGDYEHLLQSAGFLRVHRSHLVNLAHVRRLMRGKIARILMSNGDEVDVSDKYREGLFNALNVVRRR
ncbi:MAG: response regulator transcription factor [Candidatus Kapabacteria bacterium]|nr:response regulator transcription factor [Candidatus Kapabacteria bacterium]